MSAFLVPSNACALSKASRVDRFGLLGLLKKRFVSPCILSQPSRTVSSTPDCFRTL